MVRRLLFLSVLALSGFAAATTLGLDGRSSASAAPDAAPFRGAGLVVRVLDGDTLDVRLQGGQRVRVRILGIDAPALRPRQCYAMQATAAARRFAQGKRVRLVGDRTQARRDRSNRLLAYVALPGGVDLGRKLVAGGFATVHMLGSRAFLRAGPYRSAQSLARNKRLGLWRCDEVVPIGTPPPAPPPPTSSSPPPTTTSGTTTTFVDTTTGTTTEEMPPPLGGGCHASYPEFCILPPPPLRTCFSFNQRSFTVRHDVPNPDPHRLDDDQDGRGCE